MSTLEVAAGTLMVHDNATARAIADITNVLRTMNGLLVGIFLLLIGWSFFAMRKL